jgi:outer membrane protein
MGLAKGDLYLSGTVNYSNLKTGNDKTNLFTVAPGVGYMVTENIALEGSLGYISSTVDKAGIETKDTGFEIAAGAKYFFTPADKFSLSVGGSISYTSLKNQVGNANSTTGKVIGVNIPVGLHYFVSNNIALTSSWGGLGYSSDDNGGNGNDATNEFNIGLDLSAITFGMIYKL